MGRRPDTLPLDYPLGGADRLLRGLAQEYRQAAAEGRLDAWAGAGHAIIDLLANPVVAENDGDRPALSPLRTDETRDRREVGR